MRPSAVLFAVLSALCLSPAYAHFLLHYPTTIGFDDDLEETAPCGSFTPNFAKDTITDFHVGGDSIALQSVHPQVTWLFRATLDKTASSNWTDLLPAVLQSGLARYCERDVTVPSSFVGQEGILQIASDAPDGVQYQCAAVRFVSGTKQPPASCQNGTGLDHVAYTHDKVLSSLPAGPTSAPGGSSSSSDSQGAATAVVSTMGLGLVFLGVATTSAMFVMNIL